MYCNLHSHFLCLIINGVFFWTFQIIIAKCIISGNQSKIWKNINFGLHNIISFILLNTLFNLSWFNSLNVPSLYFTRWYTHMNNVGLFVRLYYNLSKYMLSFKKFLFNDQAGVGISREICDSSKLIVNFFILINKIISIVI